MHYSITSDFSIKIFLLRLAAPFFQTVRSLHRPGGFKEVTP
jgi:hypothetical protein